MKLLRLWWEGRPFENEPGSGFFLLNHYHRHWTSRASHAVWNYFKAHHQWIIGVAVAIVLGVVYKNARK